jgi:tetratricopeptide (TPR) repeat protein
MKKNQDGRSVLDITLPETTEAMQNYLLGNWEQARTGFRKLVERDPSNHFYYFILGEILYAMGRLQEAVEHYRNAVERKPDFGVAFYKMGVCDYRMGKLEKSLESFSTLLSMKDQSHAMASYFYGIINLFLGNDEDAERGFQMLQSESGESRISNFYLALLKMKHQKHEESLALLEELLKVTPNLAEVHFMKGTVYMSMHKNMDAVACFRKALELNPLDKRARANLELLTEVPEP